MERTKLLTLVVIGLFLLNLFTLGFVLFKPTSASLMVNQQGPPEGEGPARLIMQRLHFDERQKQQYQTLIDEHQKQTRLLNEKTARLYRDYYGLLATTPPDSVQAKALSQQIADNQRAIAELNFAHFQGLKALCRPDQQVYFTQLVDELARLFGRRQHPPRRGEGPPEGGMDGPPEGRPDGPPKNFGPRP